MNEEYWLKQKLILFFFHVHRKSFGFTQMWPDYANLHFKCLGNEKKPRCRGINRAHKFLGKILISC